jgi:hypothetical protein
MVFHAWADSRKIAQKYRGNTNPTNIGRRIKNYVKKKAQRKDGSRKLLTLHFPKYDKDQLNEMATDHWKHSVFATALKQQEF